MYEQDQDEIPKPEPAKETTVDAEPKAKTDADAKATTTEVKPTTEVKQPVVVPEKKVENTADNNDEVKIEEDDEAM